MTNVTMLCHGRMKLTIQALRSMGDVPNLTVLDDASPGGATLEPASAPNLLVIANKVSAGTGAARNQVIAASESRFGRGQYLYLSDNDVCFLTTAWLPILIERYERAWEHGFRVLGAYNHPFHQQQLTEVPEVREVEALALQSMLMRWEVWDAYGPFVPTPVGKVCQSEDVAFARKLKDDGYRIGVISPALVVNTGITNSFGDKIPGWETVKAQVPEGVFCE